MRKFLPAYLKKVSLDIMFFRAFASILTLTTMPLIEASLSIVDCRHLLDKQVVFTIPNVDCFAKQHVGPAAFALGVMMLFFVILPIFLSVVLYYLWKNKKIVYHSLETIASTDHDHDDHEHGLSLIDEMTEHLYANYKPEYFFMEPIMILERGLIVAFFAIFDTESDVYQVNAYVVLFAAIW
ncbi:hypothetical protein HDU76_003622 [Blyttiomyces sp. JEL0837]|nr:hypothetical protein HDU76_003622 [Blyttiomyces sp. JEL0837]